jgi:predicted HAD superfamily phosphohydrolase YqeG|tara:strand:- start:464 stop:787 length:324 start_codon:yes stop_codon:yes gene_type:complete
LFQSCVSFNTISYHNLPYQTLRKIEVKKLDKKRIKGLLISVDETAVILENNGLTQTILKNEIYDVKIRSFSHLKTATIGLTILIGTILILPPFPPPTLRVNQNNCFN